MRRAAVAVRDLISASARRFDNSGEYLLKTARHREAYIEVNIYFAVLKTENAADAGEISEVFVRKIDSEGFAEVFALRLTQKIKCIGIGCGNKTVLYEVIREEPYCVEAVFGRRCVCRNALGGDTHRAAVPDCGDMLRCGNIGVCRKLNESITRHCIGNAAAVQSDDRFVRVAKAERERHDALFTDTDSKYYTFEEYKTLIKDNQTDKDGNLIYLYANNKDEQYSYIEAATNKGYNVLLMDGQLDIAVVSMLEQKFEKVRFTRVDSDIIDNLIVKEDKKNEALEAGKQEVLSSIFKSQLPKMDKTEFNITAQALGENATPIMITQSEYMRRMKEMANIQAGMSFYGEMPDMFNLVLNSDHKLVKEVLADEDKECAAAVAPVQAEMDEVNKQRTDLKKKQEGKKDEDIPTAEKDKVNELDKKWDELKTQKEGIFADYAAKNKVVRQLIDLALLQNGMLKGEALNNFVKRSIDLIK